MWRKEFRDGLGGRQSNISFKSIEQGFLKYFLALTVLWEELDAKVWHDEETEL